MSTNEKLAATITHLADLASSLLQGESAIVADLRGRLAVAEGRAKDAQAEVARVREATQAQPVSLADEFEAAEEIAKLRRERDALQAHLNKGVRAELGSGGKLSFSEIAVAVAQIDEAKKEAEALKRERDALKERAEKAEEDLGAADAVITSVVEAMGDERRTGHLNESVAKLRRERDEALKKAKEIRGKLRRSQEVVRDFNVLVARAWSALDLSAGGALDEAVAGQHQELLDLRGRVTNLIDERDAAAQTAEANWQEVARERDAAVAQAEKLAAEIESSREEQEAIRTAMDWAGPLPRGGLPEAVNSLKENRDALLGQLEAAEKKTQAFPGAEIEELKAECVRLRQSRDIVTADLTSLCALISDGEHSSYVLASTQVEEMRTRLSTLSDWQTSISAALECSPANARDRAAELKSRCLNTEASRNAARDLVERLKRENAALRMTPDEQEKRIDEIADILHGPHSDSGCSCHISAPCAWCTEGPGLDVDGELTAELKLLEELRAQHKSDSVMDDE